MTLLKQIETLLSEALNPAYLDIQNESHMHSVPKDSETHFKVVVVSERFADKKLVERHRSINALLEKQFEAGLHALALHTYTPDEWAAKNHTAAHSPKCLGGSKSG